MRWPRSNISWLLLGCAVILIVAALSISISFWSLPRNSFTLKPLQLDRTNPVLGEWRVIGACDTPALPSQVRFSSMGTWESLTDPTIQGTYHLLDPEHIEMRIHNTTIPYTISVEPYRLVLWHGTAHQTLVRDTIQFSKCGGD